MTSPVSPLATAREMAEEFRELVERDFHPGLVGTHGVLDFVDTILAALDSLDGTITLSREEAVAVLDLADFYARTPDDREVVTLLAARIEEAA